MMVHADDDDCLNEDGDSANDDHCASNDACHVLMIMMIALIMIIRIVQYLMMKIESTNTTIETTSNDLWLQAHQTVQILKPSVRKLI